MTRLLEILISMAIVAVLFLVVGVVLPSSRSLSESVETNRRISIVFDTINSLRRFDDWSAISAYDPAAQLNISGPEEGVGARVDYVSDVDRVGEGSWEITESEPDRRVAFAVDNSDLGSNKRTAFTLTPTGRNNRNVEITQTYNVDYGWNLFGRYSGLYVSRSVGDQMKLGLGRLTNILAAVPNVEYRVEGSKLGNLMVEERPSEHLLVVNAGAVERNNDVIKASMKANMEWINRTIAASNLEAVGPMRVITTELGRETYTFDIAQRVRRGSGAAPGAEDAATDAGDADATAAADAVPAAPVAGAGPPLANLRLQGPVTYVQTAPASVAKASYIGFMAELDNVRNAVRAWAVTRGYAVADRPYEDYKNGIDAAFTESGEYDVYWTLGQPQQ